MRRNSNTWSVTCGVKTGHHHLYKGANCQDAAVITALPELHGRKEIAIGIGCDGCGEGQHSEMGALALANFALTECLKHHLCLRSPTETLKRLFPAVIRFIDSNVNWNGPHFSDAMMDAAHIAEFIKHYWLATMMGFILTEEEGVLFWCGDGTFAIDDEATQYIDQENSPLYIAYNCLYMPESVGVTARDIPIAFSTMVVNPKKRIMIASDGFAAHNEDKLYASFESRVAAIKEELPDSLEGQQWGKRGQFGLKKWMNSRSDRGYFDDDCFIITAERQCNE